MKSLFSRSVIVLFIVVGFAGVATMGGCTMNQGQSISSLQSQDMKIVDGKTTEKQLIATLGEPQNTRTTTDGTTVLTWVGSQEYHSALFFVAALYGQSKYKSYTLNAFVKNGVVIKHTIMSTNYGE